MRERWRPVVGHPGYEVSDLGRVRSLDRVIMRRIGKGMTPDSVISHRCAGRILKPGRSSNGYLTVVIEGESVPVQWLVAAAFIGLRPDGLLVLHGDGDKRRNVPSNLRYGTHAENAEDAAKHGTKCRGEGYASAKLTEAAAGAARALRGDISQYELAALLGVSPAAIQAVHDARTWKHAATISKSEARSILSEVS